MSAIVRQVFDVVGALWVEVVRFSMLYYRKLEEILKTYISEYVYDTILWN